MYECNDEETRDRILKKFAPVNGLKLEDVAYSTECQNVGINLRIRKVVKTDKSHLPGLLFDVDLYKQYKEPLVSTSIGVQLEEFKKNIRSDEFLVILNSILAE